MRRQRSIEVVLDEQVPRKKSFLRTIRRNFHWKCCSLTIIIISCAFLIIWCQVTHNSYLDMKPVSRYDFIESKKGPCEQGYNFIPIAFSVMLYVVYIMECWHCKTRLDSITKVDVSAFNEYIAELKAAMPVIWWRAVCYHYLRKTRQVTRYRNGDSMTTTQVYYERVNSHSSGNVFLYMDAGVKDISKRLTGLEQSPVTKVRFSKGFVFANYQSANEFEDQRARFFQENEQRDDYMEVREGMDLADVTLKEQMAVFGTGTKAPWFLTDWCFWLCSFLLSSWPLRLLIECKTSYVNYQVTKLFGTNYLSPGNPHYTGPLTRVSTMDSRELEALLNTAQYVLVPSYSEALLMNTANNHQESSDRIARDSFGHFHIRNGPAPFLFGDVTADDLQAINNERVIQNYGAAFVGLSYPAGMKHMVPQPPLRVSRSMSFARFPFSRQPGRSISFGDLVAGIGGRAYTTLPATPEETADCYDDSPPSYESALKMRPIQARGLPFIRRSQTSDSWFRRLNQFAFGGQSSSSGRAGRENDLTDDKNDTLL